MPRRDQHKDRNREGYGADDNGAERDVDLPLGQDQPALAVIVFDRFLYDCAGRRLASLPKLEVANTAVERGYHRVEFAKTFANFCTKLVKGTQNEIGGIWRHLAIT